MIRRFALVAATAAMAAIPVAAQAAPPRASAPVTAESESLRGSPFLIPVLIALALGLAIMALSDGSETPLSP